jgi:hypothetical protein
MPPKKYEEHLLRGTEITANLDLGAPGASVGDAQVFEAPSSRTARSSASKVGAAIACASRTSGTAS